MQTLKQHKLKYKCKIQKFTLQRSHSWIIASLNIREMQIKTTMKYLLVLFQNSSYQKKKTTYVGMWRKENSYTVVRDVNLYSLYGNNTEVYKKLKIEPH
jgi:hypothetical protein